ncbi:hypothetical protein F511_38502 [Dorcoceras hygrometricum]|uniref:Uncharacterized protein n=1 Tax=Dorcoceras hygrometricum TaxID=472368 RepID=A0A2Z7CYR8_9LAMI|nr:hypothetical protein F511_38502 [Dorcoceras hygrometricum]
MAVSLVSFPEIYCACVLAGFNQISRACFVVIVAHNQGCEGERRYRTLISCWDLLATMRRVVNYHSSWARQRQVELFDASAYHAISCAIYMLFYDCSPYWSLTPVPPGLFGCLWAIQVTQGTPELEQHCLYQVVEDFKLDHQLGKAEEQFKRRIKQSSSVVNEAQNFSSVDQVQRTMAVIECKARNLLDGGTLSSEDDEDQLKSGCKREEKKRALNGLKKQPARTRPAQCRPE